MVTMSFTQFQIFPKTKVYQLSCEWNMCLVDILVSEAPNQAATCWTINCEQKLYSLFFSSTWRIEFYSIVSVDYDSAPCVLAAFFLLERKRWLFCFSWCSEVKRKEKKSLRDKQQTNGKVYTLLFGVNTSWQLIKKQNIHLRENTVCFRGREKRGLLQTHLALIEISRGL